MHGQRIGYVRVRSLDQNPERQLEHVALDRVFADCASGKDTERPQLEALLSFIREGGIPQDRFPFTQLPCLDTVSGRSATHPYPGSALDSRSEVLLGWADQRARRSKGGVMPDCAIVWYRDLRAPLRWSRYRHSCCAVGVQNHRP